MQASPPTLITTWLNSLTQLPDNDHNCNNNHEVQNHWPHDPSTLITTSTPRHFTLGTGSSIHRTLTPHLSHTNHELLLVTCFWAPSPSLSHLSQLLLHLSAKSLSRPPHTPRIRVRICLSSLSLVQKLFHTPSLTGHIYPVSTWVSKLSLPPPEELRGLDLQVKSIFVRPFSVMHPKFVVVDRARVWVPSCNVSWEAWFEGCVELGGPVVGKFVEFWRGFWGRDEEFPSLPSNPVTDFSIPDSERPTTPTDSGRTDTLPRTIAFPPTTTTADIPTIFLPSPHTRNPNFRPFPWQSPPPTLNTPLNTFLLHAFRTATKSIYIQTPNLTSPPVMTALLAALDRGVDVHVVTNRRMMLLEQLVTAGTVTELCVWWLRRSYERRLRRAKAMADEERGRRGLGRLSVEYYRPVAFADRGGVGVGEEPAKSHLKMTVVDGEVLLLGSGNMDRASWFTSQEVGVAFLSAEMAGMVLGTVRGCLVGRVEEFYCST